MGDSLFLDEVTSFLHNMDNSSGTELQLLDVTPIDDLFTFNNKSFSPDPHTDSDCTSVECESVASSSSPPPVKDEVVDVRSRDAIRRSTYRQKQKAHRDELYQQVEDLSLKLTTLQKKKEKVRQGVGLSHTTVWKALANRHLQARLLAEEQRRRLHQAVEKTSKLIQDLGQLVRKRISEEYPEGDAGFPVKKHCAESPDMALYEAYIRELDEIYAQTDKIFKDTGMDVCNDVQGYSSPRRVVKDSSYHELVGRSTTPFAFQQVRGQIGLSCTV